MDNADATGTLGIVIGAGIAMSALMLPWEISLFYRHILFWIGTVIAVAGAFWLADLHYFRRNRQIIRFGSAAVLAVGLVALITIVEWPQRPSQFSRPTTRDVFNDDFKESFIGMFQVETPYSENLEFPVYVSIFNDKGSKSGYISIYITDTTVSIDIAIWVAPNYKLILKRLPNIVSTVLLGDIVDSNDIKYTDLVYVYHDSIWNNAQRRSVEAAFLQNGLRVDMRGIEYANKVQMQRRLLKGN